MNKKFSTLAALLLASGAGYTLVQAALSEQSSFKPGVNYVISTGIANGDYQLSVTETTAGVKVAAATFADGAAIWTPTTLGGKIYLATADGKMLSKTFGLTSNTADALEVALSAAEGATKGAIQSGESFLAVGGNGALVLVAEKDAAKATLLFGYTADATAAADLTADIAVGGQMAVTPLAETDVALDPDNGTLKFDGTVTSLSAVAEGLQWTVTEGKLGNATYVLGSTTTAADDGPVSAAAGNTTADFSLDGTGALMSGEFFVSIESDGVKFMTSAAKKLSLYKVTDGAVATVAETTMPTEGTFVIAPQITERTAPTSYIKVDKDSKTVGSIAYDATKLQNWTLEAATGDSVYVKYANGYLDRTIAANAVTGLSISADKKSMFKVEAEKIGSNYGAKSYYLKIDKNNTGAVTFAEANTTSGIKVYADIPVSEAISTGTTDTEFTLDSMVIGTPDAKDYLFFVIDGKYLAVTADGGAIEVLDTKPTDAATALRASWTCASDKYTSVFKAGQKLTVAEGLLKAAPTTPFTLGAGSTIAYEGGKVYIQTGVEKAYLLVDADGNYIVSKDLTKGTPVLMNQQLSLVAAPANTTVAGRSMVTDSWSSSMYYLLSDGTNAIKVDGTVAAATSDMASNPEYLWKMSQKDNENNVYSYSFTNMKDKTKKLTVGATTTFTSNSTFNYQTAKGLVLKFGGKFVKVNTAGTALELDDTGAATFALYEAGNLTYPTADLNEKLGNSFVLGSSVPEGKTIEESALINQALRAVKLTVDGKSAQYFVVASTCNIPDGYGETSAMQVTEALLKDAEFVAVGTEQYLAEEDETGKGFAYATVKGSDLFDFAKNKAKAGIDKAQFTTEYSINFEKIEDVNSLIITQNIKFGTSTVTVRPQVMKVQIANAAGVKEDKYLLITMRTTDNVSWSVINFDGNNGVANNYFDGKAYNAYVGNTKEAGYEREGWVFGPQMNTIDPAKSNINLNGAEGQFVIRHAAKVGDVYANSPVGFYMYNRESTSSVFLGNSIFEVRDANNEVTNKFYLAGAEDVYGDTIQLAKVDLCHARLGGYGHYLDASDDTTIFDAVSLAKTAYRIGIKNGAFDGIAYISNSSVHNNQLSVNIKDEDGLRFFFVPTTNNSADTVAYGLNNSGKKYYEVVADAAKDSLYRVSYAIQERTTKRFVGFNSDQKLELNSTVKDAAKAQQFFIKEKGDGKFVIVVRNDDNHNSNSHPSFDQKVFANIGDASLHYTNIYDGNIADEFVLDTITAPKYADILKTLKKDSDTTLVKINLYSVENLVGTSSYMLTPGANNFLMEGVPAKSLKAAGGKEYPAAGFDLVVDTAYVNRLGNTMPMYYLAMNGAARLDSVGPLHSGDKDENDHAIDCKHFNGNDTVVGKYLFAMYDSIYFGTDKNIKPEDNCYHYTNTEHFARLRFVDAVHVKDTMIIGNDTNIAKNVMKPGIVKTNIPGNRQYDWLSGYAMADDLKKAMADHQAYINPVYDNFGLFAFEINPANNEEYAIYNPATDLYVAYINGNVVMAPQASYYTMVDGNNGTLVDNENVETTEVTVIAGNGQVAIKNAQGKTVVICNLLGQTLANTVITSDNATINVPAGIAVVAVEGEEAVKAIVK